MMARLTSFAAALLVIVVVAAGLYWALGTEPAETGTLIEKAYGPGGAQFTFKQDVVGRGGALDGCVVCHSLEAGGPRRVAPNLHGIVGAPKARDRSYNYSTVLAEAGGTWTEGDLDSYLKKPSAFLPGTAKTLIGIADDAERGRIIAALKAN
ncbi:MAG: hypothetical protein KDJ16_14060 [Hyphomicrobiales bacterium]|nr:hypothetical protein [Hyphomicrobiales bacterium]